MAFGIDANWELTVVAREKDLSSICHIKYNAICETFVLADIATELALSQ
jgi:hypothetical protein